MLACWRLPRQSELAYLLHLDPLVCQSELYTGVSSHLGLCASYVVTNVMKAS